MGARLPGGHRRIARPAGLPGIATARERRDGYDEALRAHGIPVDERPVCLGPHDVAGAEAATAALLALDAAPTAVFAGDNRLTIGRCAPS